MNSDSIRAGGTGALEEAHFERPHLQAIVRQAQQHPPLTLSVAYPCSEEALRCVTQAEALGLVHPILVGPQRKVADIAERAGLDLSGCTLHDTPDDSPTAARVAVELCARGTAAALMKGSLHSDELLAAAVSKTGGLRTGRRASHVFVMDIPDTPRPLLITDCVVNIEPGLLEKRDIVQNALDFAHSLGIAQAKVALLSAIEIVNPAIPATVDAAALCKMADRGQIRGGILDGPLAYDNAVSQRSAQNKGIVSAVSGSPDIMLVPNLEAGNMLYKQLVYTAHAECAGLVLGMRVPIVLTSRSDTIESRVTSCALAVLRAAVL